MHCIYAYQCELVSLSVWDCSIGGDPYSNCYKISTCIIRWDKKRCWKEISILALDAAKEIYEIECTQRMRGQQVTTDWFAPRLRLNHDAADQQQGQG